MTNFRLHIISQREQFAAIRDSLPSFSSSQVTAHPPSQLMEILENGVNSRAIILWADSNFIRTLQHLSSLHDIESASHQIIAVGADLSASDAMTLGRIGISRYFDLPTDEEAFASEVIGRYESWRQSTQTAMAEAGIEDVVIGSSPPIRRLQTMIRKVAPRDRLMVLIRGETGTGKGLIAKMLHQFSTRKDKAFVEINCTAIPEGLVEAELFGHEKGAFTDAHRSRKGIFELAHGGTLFLDEIGYLKPDIQVKLLKVLEDRRFRRVGG
ncbi:MAG TPA: sigma-54 factor interaction domain-containing protein, partial [bacterium]|nr:sigma-54 factor interaction domain-containing protein [bacterium]